MHRTTPRFWRPFEQLPESVQKVARRNFRLLTANSFHEKKLDTHRNEYDYDDCGGIFYAYTYFRYPIIVVQEVVSDAKVH